ncbi:MAG TPA: serine protease [Caldilineaceae bacterium]|nr:serine protease [Caldilineaceae bacterium]
MAGYRSRLLFLLLALLVSLVGLSERVLRAAPGKRPEAERAVTPFLQDVPEIVGGEEAVPGAWPWVAALVRADIPDARQGLFCGASLISSEWVLTAAHCTYRTNNGVPTGPRQPSEVDVVVGRHRLSDSNTGSRLHVSQIIRHPNYAPTGADYDVALLRLATPATQPPIRLLRADQRTLESPGQLITVIGWGLTAPSNPFSLSDVLRQAQLPLVSTQMCTYAYGILTNALSPRMVCAGYASGGIDSCQGDSGGPLMDYDPLNQEWVQVALVSWGYGCAMPNYYSVNARLSQLTSWIDSQIPGLPRAVLTPTPVPTLTPLPTLTPVPTPVHPLTDRLQLPLINQAKAPALVNGSFESGPVGWHMHSLRKTRIIVSQDEVDATLLAHSGRYLAWLGGADLEVSVIEQIVTVPPAKPILQFWLQSRWLDTCGADYGGVVVDDLVVWRMQLCATKAQLTWQAVRVNLTAYASKTVLLQFRGETNNTKTSSFFVDDIDWGAAELTDLAEPTTVATPVVDVIESDAGQ